MPTIGGFSQKSFGKVKSELITAKGGLATVDEYVAKMNSRLNYLTAEEARMNKKIERMSQVMQRREEVLMQKWQS